MEAPKDSSRHCQLNCVVSCFFQLHLISHACVQKFDVTDTVEIFLKTKQDLTEDEFIAVVAQNCRHVVCVQGRVSASQALMPLSMLTSDAIRLIIDHR